MSTKSRPCPLCKKPRSDQFKPFCSERCRDRDLAKWFGDGYAVPGPPVDPAEIAARGLDSDNGDEF
ncbi:MAG: DNA gyrase inhibitor YacG [Pseudomonadota bacterium]